MRVAGAVNAAASAQYSLRWAQCLRTLLGAVQCRLQQPHLRELVSATERALLVCYDAAGPWANPEARRYVQELLGDRSFEIVRSCLEATYGLYSASLAPPFSSVQRGGVEVYFVRAVRNVSANVTTAGSTITLSTLTDILLSKMRSHDAQSPLEESVIVVIRDLTDLMEGPPTAGEGGSRGSGAEAASLAVASQSDLLLKAPDKPRRPYAPTPKLTGRHEILHGEYSSRGPVPLPEGTAPDSSYLTSFLTASASDHDEAADQERSADYDHALSTFLEVAHKWMQLGQREEGDFNLDWTQTASSLHSLTLVSCNWERGENFTVNFGGDGAHVAVDGVTTSITHVNLLSTGSYEPVVPVAEDTVGLLPSAFGSAASLLSAASAEETKSRDGLSRPASRPSMAASSADLGLEGSRPPSRSALASRASSRKEVAIPEPPAPPPPPPRPAFESTAAFAAAQADAEKLMNKLRASLPRSASVQVTEPSPLRTLQCVDDGTRVVIDALPVQLSGIFDTAEDSWWRKAAERRASPGVEDVRISCGPHVVRCGATSAVVALDAVSSGRVHCTLYEVPVHMQYADVVGVVSTAVDRAKLRKVDTKTQYCAGWGERNLVFQFEHLMPYCCYCAVVDPHQQAPAVALFRTLGLPTSTVSSILVCPISAEDYCSPSARLNRLSTFASITRSPAASIFCLDYDSAVLRNRTGEARRYKGDLNYLRKQANIQNADAARQEDADLRGALPFVVHNPARTAGDDGSVFVSTHGSFCYIATQNEGSTTLRKVIHAVRALRYSPEVKLVVLMVNQPLIRYLRLRADGQFACDGPFNHHKLLCCLLMMTLLDWKALDDGNDCKIVCTAPVSTPKLVMVRYAQHLADAVDPHARHDDLSLQLHRESPVAVGTAGTALQQGGQYLEMPSLVEPSLEEPSMFRSVALQSVLRERRQLLGERSLESVGGVEVRHLDSIYESIDDFSITDLQLQNQISAALTASQDSRLAEQSVHMREAAPGKAGFLTMEHLILPVNYHTVEGEEVDEHITLPDGRCLMEDIIEYEVLHEFTAEETGVHAVPPRLELYRDSLKPEERVQPVVYRLDLMVHRLKAPAPPDLARPAVDAGLLESSVDSHAVSFNMQHRLYLRPLLSEVDLVELLLGPVIGTVTETTAIVLFEFSTNLRQLSCVLQPLGAQDENDYVYKTIEGVKGYELLELQFAELLPGTYYEIYLPDLHGTHSIGRFKTIQTFLAFAQIAVTSANTLSRQPITPVILDQLQHQQSPNLLEIRMLNELILEDQRLRRNTDAHRIVTYGGYDNTWARLGDHLATPGVPTAAVFHLGDITLLSTYWSTLVRCMIEQTRRLEIPLRDASTVGQWYFKQVEQVVKDTFRLFWNTPVIQEVLSHTANLPLYNAHYLLPLSALEDEIEAARIAGSEQDNLLLQLVRRVFESHLHLYLSRLYGWDANNSSHTIHWRSNSLVVLGLDTVSGRRKIRKKGEGDEEDETAAEVAQPFAAAKGAAKVKPDKAGKGDKKVDMKDPFSLGFIDRSQWKGIRALVLDRTVTHVVILTLRPVIPLAHLAKDFRAPESVPKGEVLDWQPTQDDIEIFLKFWFDWLAMYQKGEIASCRSLLLVSTCRMPYSTLIQDLKTGLKIQQLCVGEYDKGGARVDIPYKPKGTWPVVCMSVVFVLYVTLYVLKMAVDLSMSGKLGTIRYVHQLEGQDYYLAQSTGIEKNSNFIERSAEQLPSPTASGTAGPTLHLSKSAGFATLRVWFDSWKALGIWSQESPETSLVSTTTSNATLLVGPMLGVPVLHTEPATETHPARSYFTVAMLLEVDRTTTVVLQGRSVFTDHEVRIELPDCPPRRPFVAEIGPLQLEDRYNFRLTAGLKASPHNTFSIDTYTHENETNIMALNCAPVVGEVSGSQIIIEAAKRCSVPFCGIAAVLHTNFQPSFDRVINEFRYSNALLDGLKEARRTGQLSPAFRIALENMIEVFRDEYRTVLSKPSYAELLRSGFNLMMQNTNLGISEENEPDPSSELYQIVRLVKLIVARLNQEYFDKWMMPHMNVFRAERSSDPNAPVPAAVTVVNAATGEVTVTPAPKPKVIMDWSDPLAPAVDSVFRQWLSDCKPALGQRVQWVAANGKTSVEQIFSVNEDNFATVADQLARSPIECGTRIIVINEDPAHHDAADPLFLGESDLGVRFQDLLQAWKRRQGDREVCIICPTLKYGTRKIDVKLIPIEPPLPPPEPVPPPDPLPEGYVPEPVPPAPLPGAPVFKEVYAIDSAYRSNEFQRLQRQSSADKELQESQAKGKKKMAAAAAKSKRAQRQREEEERLRKEEVAREIAEIKASQVPDGYLIIGCVTTSIATPDFTATVTNPPRVSIIGDFIGTDQEREEMHDDMIEGIPTAYDFIQLPEWFRKFSPSMESMFVRDEVLLLMRQNPETKRILNVIEDGDYIPQLIALYEKSRLSELSRPEDLREVDMGITGVVPMFFRDLVKKMWDLAVPAEVKPHMFSLSDEFIMSYCFARALPDTAPLSSGIEFARAVQYTLVLSLSLRSAQIMSKLERYAYIIRSPDYPTQKVKAMEQKEKIIVDEKFDLYNRKEAADKAWRLADPKAADERLRLEKEAAEEAAALEAAQLAISKKDVTAAAALKAARELQEMAKDVEKTLAVVEINYDSDLEAIENDEAEEQRRIRAAERLESIKQHDVDHTTMSIKMHTSQRAERVKAEMTSKERAAAEEEEGRLATGDEFDVEAEGMEKLDQMRSEWLVAAMEVVMEVAIEKEIYDAVKAASHQLLEECFEEARANKLSVGDEGRLEHAKLQVSRLRSETAKSRRVYGRRMSFMA
jgi:hypothetical protein